MQPRIVSFYNPLHKADMPLFHTGSLTLRCSKVPGGCPAGELLDSALAFTRLASQLVGTPRGLTASIDILPSEVALQHLK